MTSLKLKFRGDPVLSKVSKPAEDIQSDEFQDFAEDLIEACFEYDGVGIAAPQVGRSISVFIILSADNRNETDEPAYFPEVIINPEILSHSDEQEEDWEGCLSVPDLRGRVKRYINIDVEYTSIDGAPVKKSLQGHQARVFQHEFDHLRGILYPERMEEGAELITIDELEKRLEEEDISEDDN